MRITEFFTAVQNALWDIVLRLFFLKQYDFIWSYKKKEIQWRRKSQTIQLKHSVQLTVSWKLELTLQRFIADVYAVLISSQNAFIKNSTVNIFFEYEDLKNVFKMTENLILSDHSSYDHVIDLKLRKKPSFDLLYNLSATGLSTLHKYLKQNLEKKMIHYSIFSAASSLLFTFKKNDELCLCVNYQALNNITIKNQYSLLLISEALNCLQEAQIFTKLNVKNAYNWIRIKEENKWKTAFQTCFRLFKYLILFFRLINTSVFF